jgi:hypothetical protein
MPDAAYYCRQSQMLRSTASNSVDPAVASRLRALAEDYQAIAALLTDTRDTRLAVLTAPEDAE